MHDRLIIAPVHSKCDIQQPLAEQHQYDQCEQDVHGVTAGGGVRDDFPFLYIHITIIDRTRPTYISRDSSSLYLTLYLVSSLIFIRFPPFSRHPNLPESSPDRWKKRMS